MSKTKANVKVIVRVLSNFHLSSNYIKRWLFLDVQRPFLKQAPIEHQVSQSIYIYQSLYHP